MTFTESQVREALMRVYSDTDLHADRIIEVLREIANEPPLELHKGDTVEALKGARAGLRGSVLWVSRGGRQISVKFTGYCPMVMRTANVRKCDPVTE